MSVRLLLPVALALTACGPAAPPLEVDLTVAPASAVPAAMLASVTTLKFTVDGDEAAEVTRPLDHPLGTERIVYTPQLSGTLRFSVTALDGNGDTRLHGSSTVTVSGAATAAQVTLAGWQSPGLACGDDSECGTDLCTDGVCCNQRACGTEQVCGAAGACVDWDPTQLTQLALWLEPSGLQSPDGVTVQRWKDHSRRFNDGVAGGNQWPQLVPTAINGHAAAHFSDGFFDAGDDASLRWGTGAYLVAVVTRFTGGGPEGGVLFLKAQTDVSPYYGAVLFATDPAVPFHTHGLVAQVDALHTVPFGDHLDDGNWRIVVMRRSADGTNLELRVGGVPLASSGVPMVDVSAPSHPVYIGGRYDGLQPLKGDIAEVVAAVDDSPEHLARLEHYLAVKYGL